MTAQSGAWCQQVQCSQWQCNFLVDHEFVQLVDVSTTNVCLTCMSDNKQRCMQVCSGAARTVTSANSSQSVKLAVIGGGIGGLTFTRILQNHGHDVVIFEREPSRNARTQGGNLDMHEESGQWALRQAGLYDRYSELILEGGQDLCIVDHKAKVHWEEVGPPGELGRPEIHRPALRNLLLDALHPDTIKWDRRLVGIEPQGSQGHTLRFADGATVTAELVIGADGARSCVRPLVTDAKASYCGAGYFDISIPDVDASHPDVAKFAGRGSMCALWDNKAILSQRAGDGSVRAWATCRMSEDSFTKLGKTLKHLSKRWLHCSRGGHLSLCNSFMLATTRLLPGHIWPYQWG